MVAEVRTRTIGMSAFFKDADGDNGMMYTVGQLNSAGMYVAAATANDGVSSAFMKASRH